MNRYRLPSVLLQTENIKIRCVIGYAVIINNTLAESDDIIIFNQAMLKAALKTAVMSYSPELYYSAL